MPAGVQQRQVRFSRFRTLLRDGDTVGEIRVGDSCGSLTRLVMNPRTEQAIMSPALRAVREELGRAGYKDPTRAPQRLFEEDNEAAGPDLLLGGMLEEFRTSYCSSGSGARTDGWVRMKVRWELYDVAERKVVHAKTVETTSETTGSEAIREGEFFARAYRASVRALLADRQFYNSVVMLAAPAARPGKPAAAEASVLLKRLSPPSEALSANMTLTRAAVVTIRSGRGSGSGFFVSEDGHVLTNSHVVGDSRFVRVILATGRELVGEVVRKDAARDVALIKAEGGNYVALALATGEPNVGAEVVAIGSPLGESLSGTVTRGIVSAHRVIRGKRYIQSDVALLPGNSGGPLVERSGRVVGIAVMGLGGTAINFFVPIDEALSELGIRLAGT